MWMLRKHLKGSLTCHGMKVTPDAAAKGVICARTCHRKPFVSHQQECLQMSESFQKA